MLEVFVLSGPDTGRSAKLTAGDLIGRAEGCALRLGDRSISRQHARLEARAGVLVLVDAGSTNGLTLAGERVSEVVLADFLEFTAGEVELRVRLGATVEPLAPAHPEPAAEPSFAFGGGVTPTPQPRKAPAGEDVELELEWGDEPAPAPAPVNLRENLRENLRAALLAELGGKQQGFLGGDLTQYPAWIQALVGLFVLLVGAGLFYGVYQLVLGSRGG